MYLQRFSSSLKEKFDGGLFTVQDATQIDARAKEYLHRLANLGEVDRVYWGWYHINESQQDIWDFLSKDRGFKVVVRQTAASIWNYDFVHRNVYRLAVESRSYKNALEGFGKKQGWIFEVEQHEEIPYEYREVDGLFVETPESSIVSCMTDWSFLDAFAVLYFRREDISFNELRELGRWKRVSKTDTRAWTVIKYGCNYFNERLKKRVFDVRATDLRNHDIKELIEEAIEKVIEFA